MANQVKVPITFELTIAEDAITNEVVKKIANAIEDDIKKQVHTPAFYTSILEAMIKQVCEAESAKILKSEEFLRAVANEAAKKVISNKQFVAAMANAELQGEPQITFDNTTEIEFLSLSVRTLNCLRRAGIRTIGDIKKLTLLDLVEIRNMGRHSVEELVNAMRAIGFTFAYSKEEAMARTKKTEEEADEED